MRQLLKNLRVGTLLAGSFALMVFGAAGYASFTETDKLCAPAALSDYSTEAVSTPTARGES